MTDTTETDTDELPEDPREARVEDVTRTRWDRFSRGLSILAEYQEDLPEDAPLFFLEDVSGDEIGEPGMYALVAIANIPDHNAVAPALVEYLEKNDWYRGGTWQYRLQLLPQI